MPFLFASVIRIAIPSTHIGVVSHSSSETDSIRIPIAPNDHALLPPAPTVEYQKGK
jgi:hypothetical protein